MKVNCYVKIFITEYNLTSLKYILNRILSIATQSLFCQLFKSFQSCQPYRPCQSYFTAFDVQIILVAAFYDTLCALQVAPVLADVALGAP